MWVALAVVKARVMVAFEVVATPPLVPLAVAVATPFLMDVVTFPREAQEDATQSGLGHLGAG